MSESDAEIARAARLWNDRRLFALQVRDERNEFRCPDEDWPRYREPGDPPSTPPCWSRDWNGDPESWCESCVERQRVHLRYREAVKARGAAMRALERLCAREKQHEPTLVHAV